MAKPLSPPENPKCYHLVREFYELLIAEQVKVPDITLHGICRSVGLQYETVRDWRRSKRDPHIRTFDAMLRRIGYKLAIVPADEE